MMMASVRTVRSIWSNSKMRVSVLSVLSLVAGCSLMVEADGVQCAQDSDCKERFGEGDWTCSENICKPTADMMSTSLEPPEWACLESAPEVSSEPGPFTVRLHVQNMANSSMAIVGAQVQLCRRLDPTCIAPDETKLTDSSGDVTFDVQKNFAGFVSITKDSYMETAYFFPVTINQNEDFGGIQLAPPVIVSALTANLSAKQSAERGIVLSSVFSCEQKGAAGVKLSAKEADGETLPFYASGSSPSATLMETETSGFGGFINAPPGIFTIEAHRSSDGRLVARSAITVRKNALNITRLVATKF